MEARLGDILSALQQQGAQLNSQVANQAQAMQQQAAYLEQVRQQSDQQLRALREGIEAQNKALGEALGRGRRQDGVVDVSRVGKPDALRGATKQELRKAWPDWSYTFRTSFCSQFEQGDEVLKWAQERYDQNITSKAVDEALQVHQEWGAETLKSLARQLHVSLTALCRDDALSLVKNSEKGPAMGLDAWRRLCKEFDPVNATSNRKLLRRLTHPPQASLDTLRRFLEEWEADLRESTGQAETWRTTRNA